MYPPSKILVVDLHSESASFLIRALSRKFPAARIDHHQLSQSFMDAISSEVFDTIVLHRTEEDAVTLIKAIRKIDPLVVIIAVSGADRSEQVLAAGATGFLNYDQWLMIGSVVKNALLQEGATESE